MMLDNLRSEIMFNRALLFAVLARQTLGLLGILLAACSLWYLLAALMGVDE